MRKPTIATGALIGLMVTAPLMGVYYLANQLLGLGIVPFEIFDWLRNLLPGNFLIRGIELMIRALTALGLSVREASKPTETITVLIIFMVAGILAGLIFFAIMRRAKPGTGLQGGLILGAVAGLILGAIIAGAGGSAPDTFWTLVSFLGWGAAIGWAYQKLAEIPVPQQAEAEALTVEQMGRRGFLIRMGAASAAVTVVGAGVGALLATRTQGTQPSAGVAAQPTPQSGTPVPLPNAGASVEPAPGTRPEYTPLDQHYRIDIDLIPPEVDGTTWKLPITGLVDNQLNLTLDDLRNNYKSMDQYITLSCISNPVGGDLISTIRWTGVSVQTVLKDAGVKPEARYLALTSADGFTEIVDLAVIQQDPRVMFTYAWDGVPLRTDHGYPLRIYIPDRYGMKQPKWIINAELVANYQDGYWVQRGWDKEALVKSTSVIDTVAVDNAYTSASGEKLIPVGGIAYAGDKGISGVEVKVDEGEWVEAQLRTPLSQTTWVIWRYDWPFQAGGHTFYVRCRDGKGTPQIETPADTFPSGATGIYSKRI